MLIFSYYLPPMAKLTSVNPYTQELNGTFETLSNQELDTVINHAHGTYLARKDTSFSYRKELFHKLAKVIEDDLVEIAKLQTQEMGMLYVNSTARLK
ncbi:aldehyde dehydrogenase family protein [Patescibacteria group bacterium]|nr:aldehyde dehydrogenase family protein [Patescibacteria group bacterium]